MDSLPVTPNRSLNSSPIRPDEDDHSSHRTTQPSDQPSYESEWDLSEVTVGRDDGPTGNDNDNQPDRIAPTRGEDRQHLVPRADVGALSATKKILGQAMGWLSNMTHPTRPSANPVEADASTPDDYEMVALADDQSEQAEAPDEPFGRSDNEDHGTQESDPDLSRLDQSDHVFEQNMLLDEQRNPPITTAIVHDVAGEVRDDRFDQQASPNDPARQPRQPRPLQPRIRGGDFVYPVVGAVAGGMIGAAAWIAQIGGPTGGHNDPNITAGVTVPAVVVLTAIGVVVSLVKRGIIRC